MTLCPTFTIVEIFSLSPLAMASIFLVMLGGVIGLVLIAAYMGDEELQSILECSFKQY